MTKYNRIKLEITDLSPESASKVFQFIHSCLNENDLNIKFFKTNINNYSIDEQHFIFDYSKKYFSSSQRSYLNRWIENLENQFGRREQSLNYVSNIIKGSEEILNYIQVKEKTVERQFKVLKKKDLYINIKSNAIKYRIPLYFKVKDQEKRKVLEELSEIEINKNIFKERAKELLSEIIRDEEFEVFFNNSFDYCGNEYPIEELNLEFENSGILYSKIHKLYNYYNEVRNKQNEVVNDYLKKEKDKRLNPKDPTKKPSEIRAKFYQSQKIPNIHRAGRFEFMQIMYNAFPQIRESYYFCLQKKPSSNLQVYLKTKSRNIK
jgi:hypothetical protein